MDIAFQDQIVGNHCWGCSPTNESGLHIKSFLVRRRVRLHVEPGRTPLRGGRPHTEWRHYREHHRLPLYMHGNRQRLSTRRKTDWERTSHLVATASLHVSYQSPTPTDGPVTLRARVTEMTAKRTNLTCSLSSGGEVRATADLVAVQVPIEWLARR